MSTPEDPDNEQLDELEDEYSDVPEDRETIGRGPDTLREELRKAAERKKQVTIRLDADIVDRFKELAGPDGSYQTLINRALREWLEARSLKRLLQDEIKAIGEDILEAVADRREPESPQA